MAPKCPNGTMFPKTLCPCLDMKEFIPQDAYGQDPLQWVRGKDHAIHMQQWMIAFPPVHVYRLGNCVYKELSKIADYSDTFDDGSRFDVDEIYWMSESGYAQLAPEHKGVPGPSH